MSCSRIVVYLDGRDITIIHVARGIRGKIAKDTMGLESEQLCPVAIMVQEIMSNNKVDNDPYLYLDPHPRVSRYLSHGCVLLILLRHIRL